MALVMLVALYPWLDVVFSAFSVHVFMGACLSYLLGATTKNKGYSQERSLNLLCIGMSRFDLKLLHLCVGFVFLGFRQDASLVVLVLNAHQVLK
jgi:hypothetical protein